MNRIICIFYLSKMARLLLETVLVVLSFSFAASINPGLRVRFGVSLNYGSDYFIDIPRELETILADGWTQIDRLEDDPALAQLDLYCPSQEYSVCAFFDDTAYLAGLQIALPMDKFVNTIPSDLTEVGFKKWTPPALEGESVREYWMIQQFYISESTLAKSTEEREALHANGETLYDGGVWLSDAADNSFNFISTDKATILTDTEWIEQACITFMGQHYFYGSAVRDNCGNGDVSNYKPSSWFILTNGDELDATGLIVYGNRTVDENKQDWFEHPNRLIVETIVPNADECIYDLTDQYGLVSLHVYYINEPYLVWCL